KRSPLRRQSRIRRPIRLRAASRRGETFRLQTAGLVVYHDCGFCSIQRSLPMIRAVNRREFLAQGTAAGAVLAVNGRGGALAGAFAAQPNAAVAYICDVDERAIGKGMEAVAKHQKEQPAALRDFRKALDDPAIDALVIA